jgi:hypothetical protein
MVYTLQSLNTAKVKPKMDVNELHRRIMANDDSLAKVCIAGYTMHMMNMVLHALERRVKEKDHQLCVQQFNIINSQVKSDVLLPILSHFCCNDSLKSLLIMIDPNETTVHVSELLHHLFNEMKNRLPTGIGCIETVELMDGFGTIV